MAAPAAQLPTTEFHCAQCNGELHPDEGQVFLVCPFCGSAVYLDKSKVVFHWSLSATLKPDDALASLHRWMAGNYTVKDLDRKAKIVSSTFQYFPLWYVKAVDAGAKVKAGNVEIEMVHTPGHTPGSQCFHVRNHLISGDTLFINACGRTDLPGGNAKELYHSLTHTLKKLDDTTVLCPGHNYSDKPTSTMGDEKKTNPYLLCDSLENFLKFRTGVAEIR